MSKNENQIKLIAELAVNLETACSLLEEMANKARENNLLFAADYQEEKIIEWGYSIDKARAIIFELQVNDSQPEYKIQKIARIQNSKNRRY